MRLVTPFRARGLVVLVAVLSFLLVAPPEGRTILPPKPNLVLILTDDQRAIDLAHMPLTKQLLGGNGVTFANAFASTPLCCPARASLLTGQYSHNHGVLHNGPPEGGIEKFDDSSTLATWLQAAGYTTSFVGKYVNGYELLGAQSFVPPGWNDWHAIAAAQFPVYYNYTLNENGILRSYGSEPSAYMTDVLATRATEFINATSGRFFLAFQPVAPHTPAIPAPGDARSTLPLPKPNSFNEADVTDKPWGSRMPRLTTKQINTMTTYWQNAVATLQAVDRAVAALVDALEQRGQLDNTVIAFSSDNGFLLGEHRVFMEKVWPYDPSVRVPLIFRLPGQVGPRTDTRFVMNVDIPATFAQLGGAVPPITQNGVSLVPHLEGLPGTGRRGVYLEFLGTYPDLTNRPLPYKAFRNARHKLILWEDGTRELYYLVDDPHELRNVATDPAHNAAEAQLEALIALHASS